MYSIFITEPAENDLKNAASYIKNELRNSVAAKSLIDETEKTIASLSEMPKRYRIVNDTLLASQGIRMAQVKNYLVFYVVREEKESVTVLRFLYAKRDWLNILKDGE